MKRLCYENRPFVRRRRSSVATDSDLLTGQCFHLHRRNPVHLSDSHNLPIVLGELNTIHDFSSFLVAKHVALKKYAHLSYCGEEDLLAHYLYNVDDANNRHFIGPKEGDYDSLMIGEGEWKDFIQLPQYKNKKRADQISELWDDVIQRTCQHAPGRQLRRDLETYC